MPSTPQPLGGGLVISLDLELDWGVFDLDLDYESNLMGAREAVPRMLEAFAQYGVGATWATVGFLFAESKEELVSYYPEAKPTYRNARLDPYGIEVGQSERDDPLHFAPSLIREIATHPRQEVASHTFSHFYCLEEGQTEGDFEADIASAVALAAARGHCLRSLVFPRNQVNPAYLPIISKHGFIAYRGAERSFLAEPAAGGPGNPLKRAARFADSFVNATGHRTVPWPTASVSNGLINVPGSRFLRPWHEIARLDEMRIRRVLAGLRAASKRGHLFHLWWHPHNFGANLAENMAALTRVLDEWRTLRDSQDFGSYTMQQVAEVGLANARRSQDSVNMVLKRH